MKIRLMGAELSRADRQTDRRTDITKLTAAFRNFPYAHRSGYEGKGEDYMPVLNHYYFV